MARCILRRTPLCLYMAKHSHFSFFLSSTHNCIDERPFFFPISIYTGSPYDLLPGRYIGTLFNLFAGSNSHRFLVRLQPRSFLLFFLFYYGVSVRDRSSIFYVSVTLPAYPHAPVAYIRFVSACSRVQRQKNTHLSKPFNSHSSHETRKPNLLLDRQLHFYNITIVYIVFDWKGTRRKKQWFIVFYLHLLLERISSCHVSSEIFDLKWTNFNS